CMSCVSSRARQGQNGRRHLGASSYSANGEVVKGRDRICLGPKPDAARLEAGVAMVQIEFAVEPALEVVAERDDAHRVPLTERRRLDAGARQLTPPAVVVVQPEVVLERVRANDVVLPVCEAEDDAA